MKYYAILHSTKNYPNYKTTEIYLGDDYDKAYEKYCSLSKKIGYSLRKGKLQDCDLYLCER